MKNIWPILLLLMFSQGTKGQTDVRRFFNTAGNTNLFTSTGTGRGVSGTDSFQTLPSRVQVTGTQQAQRFIPQSRGRVSSVTVPVIDLGTAQQQPGQAQQTTVIRQASRGQISPVAAGQPVTVGGFPTSPFGPTLVGPTLTETAFPFGRGSPFAQMAGPTLLGPNINGAGVPPPQINFPQRLPPQAISDMQAAAAQSFGTPQFGVLQTQSVGRPGPSMPFPGVLPPGPTLGQGPVVGLPPSGFGGFQSTPFNFPFGTPMPPQFTGNLPAGTFATQQGAQRQATQGVQRQATPDIQRQVTQTQTQQTVQSTRVNRNQPRSQVVPNPSVPQFNQPPQIIPAAGMPPQLPMQGPGFGQPFMSPPGFRPFAGQPFGFPGPNMRPMPPRFPGMTMAGQGGQQQPGFPQAAGVAAATRTSQGVASSTQQQTAQVTAAQGAGPQVPQPRPFMPNMQGSMAGMAQAGGNGFAGFPQPGRGPSPPVMPQPGVNQPPQMLPPATNFIPPMMPPRGTQFAGMPPSGPQIAGLPQPAVNPLNAGSQQTGGQSFAATSSQTANTASSGMSRTNRPSIPERPDFRNMPRPIIPHILPRGSLPQQPRQNSGQPDSQSQVVPTPRPLNNRQPFMALPRRAPPFGMGGPQPPVMPGGFPQPSGQQTPVFPPPNMAQPGTGNGGPPPGLFGGPIPAFPDLQPSENSGREATASDASNAMPSMPNNEPPNSINIPNTNNEPSGNSQPTETLPGFPTMIFAGPFAGGNLDANPVDSSPSLNNEPPNSPSSGRNDMSPDNDRPPSFGVGK